MLGFRRMQVTFGDLLCAQVFNWIYYLGIPSNELYTIRTLHDCPSQMNENLLISKSKLTSDSELIWWR